MNATPTKAKVTYRGGGVPRKEFTMEFLQSIASHLATKGNKASPVTVLDGHVVGLRALARPSGAVSFHIQFNILWNRGRDRAETKKLSRRSAMRRQ